MEVNVQGQETTSFNEQDQQILEGQEPKQEGQQEELIGGKFKTADELLTAYQELEKKLGSSTDTGYETKTEENAESEEVQDEAPPSAPQLSDEQENTIVESIGGEDNFKSAQDWATKNLDQSELDAYNREVNSGDYFRARNALQSIYFSFRENSGVEPELISGRLSSGSTDVYRSTSEVEAAMNDPRYLVDAAYTQDVENKMSRSDILSPKF
tara:strand:- start:215 stop:850 length:636 start_codon:yes stop_codon:yes gene_type:complete